MQNNILIFSVYQFNISPASAWTKQWVTGCDFYYDLKFLRCEDLKVKEVKFLSQTSYF